MGLLVEAMVLALSVLLRFWAGFLAAASWALGMLVFILSDIAFFRSPPKISASALDWLTAAGVLFVSAPFWVGRVRRWLFPTGVFAIGDGVQRLLELRARQKWVSLGSVLAAIVAVTLGIIANRLSR